MTEENDRTDQSVTGRQDLTRELPSVLTVVDMQQTASRSPFGSIAKKNNTKKGKPS